MRDPLPLVALHQLADLSMGATPSRAEPAFWAIDGQPGHAWVSIGDIRGKFLTATNETVTQQGVRAARLRPVLPGTPIMSFKLSLGKATIPKIPVYTNEAIVALRAIPGRAYSRWLFYAVPRVARNAISETAVKGKTLNLPKLRKLEIPTPPLEEQRRIAEILDTIDDMVDCRKQAIFKLQQNKRSLLQTLLTCGIGENGAVRDPRRNPSEFIETALGLLPRAWDIEPLGRVASYQNGGIFPSTEYTTEGVALVRPGNLRSDEEVVWTSEHTTYLPERWAQNASSYLVDRARS